MVLSDIPTLQLTYLICLQVLAELCFQGYRDAIRFLEENGMYGGGKQMCPFNKLSVSSLGKPEIGGGR